jgi:hypothetical protein
MEMTELQRAWADLDSRLARQTVELQQLRRANVFDRLRDRLRPLGTALWLQLLVGVAAVLLAGGYWTARLDQPHLVFYGVCVHLFGIGLLVTAIVQLAQLGRLEPGLPVLALQRRLLRLRRLRIGGERWLMAGGFFVWAPLAFLLLARYGMDLWPSRPGVVLGNLGFAVLLSLAMLWASYRFRDWFERDASGGSLAQAEAELGEVVGYDGDADS